VSSGLRIEAVCSSETLISRPYLHVYNPDQYRQATFFALLLLLLFLLMTSQSGAEV
jgi:hypothetical protein